MSGFRDVGAVSGAQHMSHGTDKSDPFDFSGSAKVKLKQIGAAGRLCKE